MLNNRFKRNLMSIDYDLKCTYSLNYKDESVISKMLNFSHLINLKV